MTRSVAKRLLLGTLVLSVVIVALVVGGTGTLAIYWPGEKAEERETSEPALSDLPGSFAWTGRDAPPPLPRPVEAISNAELFRYLDALVYERRSANKHRIGRCNSGTPTGCGPADQVEVLIQPEWGAHELDVASIDERGVVIARVVNFGSTPEGKYNIPAGKRAWWLVDRPVPGGPLRSRMIVRTYRDNLAVYNHEVVHPFRDCGHQTRYGDAKAKWGGCDWERTASRHVSAEHAGLLLLPLGGRVHAAAFVAQSASGSAWITCSLGCCIAGAQ